MLKWLRTIGRALRPGKKSVTAIESLFGGIPISKYSTYESYLKAASGKVWASWRACDLVAQVVSDTPFMLRRKGSSTEATSPDLQRILSYPNQFETFGEMQYKTIFHIKATGNAYWVKSEATLSGDRPRELFCLNPKRTRITTDRNGLILGYIYSAQGLQIPFNVEEVIHFRRPHPDNDFYGLGDIEAGASLIEEHTNRNTWVEGFWKNGASPSGILIRKDEIGDEEEWDRAKKKFAAQYGGAKNAGKTAWLNGDWSYQQLGLTAQEMQNIEQTKLNVEQIFTLHGVPLSVAGIRDAANYATAEIDNQRFRQYTVFPMVRIIQDTINTDLVQGFGPNLELAYNVSGLINVGQIAQDYAPLFDRGVLSINEFRDIVGLPTDPENPVWNQHFLNAGMVPLDLSGVADLGQTQQQAQRTVQRFIEEAMKPPAKLEASPAQ